MKKLMRFANAIEAPATVITEAFYAFCAAAAFMLCILVQVEVQAMITVSSIFIQR